MTPTCFAACRPAQPGPLGTLYRPVTSFQALTAKSRSGISWSPYIHWMYFDCPRKIHSDFPKRYFIPQKKAKKACLKTDGLPETTRVSYIPNRNPDPAEFLKKYRQAFRTSDKKHPLDIFCQMTSLRTKTTERTFTGCPFPKSFPERFCQNKKKRKFLTK